MATVPSLDPRFGFDPVAAFLRRPPHEVTGENGSSHGHPPPRAPRTVRGLRDLCQRHAWLAVLELATSLLAEHDEHDETCTGPTHPFLPHERLLVVAYRALALLQTRQVASAQNAVSQLGPLTPNNKRYCYESYPALYAGHAPGTFVPFELRALAIEVVVRQGDASAIADCYTFKAEVCADRSLTERERRLREGLLLSALASYHLIAQQHDAAVDVARELARQQGDTATARYMYARVLLHVGDFEGAGAVVRAASGKAGDSKALQHLHYGMVLAARGRFQEGLLEYDSALEEMEKEVELKSPRNLWVHAGNNAAVCLVQLGRLGEAIERVEDLLRRGPEVALDEGVAFNLAVMYDLAYPQNCLAKKSVLKKVALRFGREGFDVSRIPMEEKRQ